MVGASDRRGRADASPRRESRPPSWRRRRRARRSCSAARSRGDEHPVAHRAGRRAGSTVARCSCEIGRPARQAHLERPLDALASLGAMRAAAAGSSAASSACSAGQPSRAARASSSRAQRGRGLRQGGQPVQQRAQIQHGAADQQRHAAARVDRARSPRAHRARTVPPSSSRSGRRCRSGGAGCARAPRRRAWRCRCRGRGRPGPSRR